MLNLLTNCKEYKAKDSNLDIRESMKVLPGFLQPFLTWLTGKPLKSQKSWNRKAIYHLIMSLVFLFVGITISIIALMGSGFWLLFLIPSWILTVSGARTLQSMISHQCAHFNFSGNKNIDRLLGEVISILITIRDFNLYQQDHKSNHHPKLSTLEDETVKFLVLVVGLRPGMKKKELWKNLVTTLFSPKFHLLFFIARVCSTYNSSSTIHNLIAFAFTALVLVIISFYNFGFEFFVAWVFPLTILYQISACLRLCSEHLWSEHGVSNKHDKLTRSRLTFGIFLGEKTPNLSLPWFSKANAWCIWCFRMIFIHLTTRLFVMIGDTPCHDYHHRYPSSKDWPNYIFARQRDLDAGCPGTFENYREIWGLHNAIDEVFQSISKVPSNDNVNTDNFLDSVYSLSTISKIC